MLPKYTFKQTPSIFKEFYLIWIIFTRDGNRQWSYSALWPFFLTFWPFLDPLQIFYHPEFDPNCPFLYLMASCMVNQSTFTFLLALNHV